ncbi:MAG: hypothetical protein JXA96_06465 [Sedimentisphaerales bacterium]|nr:hypothetical protein [Sedimentisphaerales bacterium]
MRNSYLIKDIKKGFLLCLMLLISGISFGQTKTLNAMDVLNEHKKSLKESLLAREKLAFKAEMKQTTKIPEKYIPSSDSLTITYLLFHESDRTDIRLEENTFYKGSIVNEYERQILHIQGLTYRITKKNGKILTSIDIRKEDNLKAGNRNIQGINAIMEGYLPSEDKFFWEMFGESDSLKLRENMETVDGHLTYVLEIKKPLDGQYILWIDPAFGFNIRKFMIKKTGSDLPDWYPLEFADPTRGPSFRFPPKETKETIDIVEIKKLGGVFVPVIGKLNLVTTYSNGEQRIVTQEYKRFDIDLNPDFSKYPDAFVLDVPDGTSVVYDQDLYSKIKYEWRDGQVVQKIENIEPPDITK